MTDPSRTPKGADGTAAEPVPEALRAPWPTPLPDAVVVRQSDASAPEPMPALLPEERALLGEHPAPRRLAEFAHGRTCARAALTALDPGRAAQWAATVIGRSDGRCPRWPEGYVGAITHHGGQALAAVARSAHYRGVGLDLEAVRPPSEGLLRRILRPEERGAHAALPTQIRAAAFMVAFSVKESIYKALFPHTGVYLGFQDAAILGVAEAFAAEAGDPAGVHRMHLRWRLHKASGAGLPVGAEGPACAVLRGGFVLSGVWLQR